MNETRKPRFSRLFPVLAALALAACSSQGAEPPLKGARVGGPFSLVDQDGRPVTDRDFAGKYRIVYFGFTHCPDVCPTDLAAIGSALRRFEQKDPDRAARVQPLFITVDPERDGPKEVGSYQKAFGAPIIGLTGSPAQIDQVNKEYGIFSQKVPEASGDYSVDHTATILLFDRNGKFAGTIAPDEADSAALGKLKNVTAA